MRFDQGSSDAYRLILEQNDCQLGAVLMHAVLLAACTNNVDRLLDKLKLAQFEYPSVTDLLQLNLLLCLPISTSALLIVQ